MLKIQENLYKKIGIIIIITILLFTIAVIIYYKGSSNQDLLLVYNTVTEKPQEIRIEGRKHINMYKKMKKDMILEKKDYNKNYSLLYGHSMLIIDNNEDYYEAFYIYGSKVLYEKRKIILESNLQSKNNNIQNKSKSYIDTLHFSKPTMIIQPNTLNDNGLLEMNLYRIDEKYFNYFFDLYIKRKK